MAPQITDGSELRFRVNNKQTLLVRELTPRTDVDFIVTTVGGLEQDQGALSTNSSAGVSSNAFYTGQPVIRGVAPGTNLFIRGSSHRPVVVVQLEG